MVRTAGINPMGLEWRRFTVATDRSDAVVGAVQYKPHGDDTVELASLVVEPAWRGQGVAGQLVRHLQAVQGPPLWLTCVSTLVPFYTRFGFVEINATDQMPVSFRRARRLMRVFMFLSRRDVYLAVMRWPQLP